jgi:PhnB protein
VKGNGKETDMKNQTKAIPEGYHTITPHLVVKGANQAIEFYRKAFGARETSRWPICSGVIATEW